METLDKFKRIDLKQFAHKHYGISSNQKGFARCPDHPPDNNPSLQFWIGTDGLHRYTDHHVEKTGSIIDFVMKREGCDTREAINFIRQNEGTEEMPKKQVNETEYYQYKTLDNQVAFRKAKK